MPKKTPAKARPAAAPKASQGQDEATAAKESGPGGQSSTTDATKEGPDASSPPHARACDPIPGQPEWVPRYLVELEETAQKADSATLAGVSLRTVQRHRASSQEFAKLEAAAMEVSADLIESVITRRAINGVVTQRTIMPDGRIVEKWDYSDMLALRLAEKIETGRWVQRQQIEHGVPGSFGTRAERKTALEKIRQEAQESEARSLGGTVPLLQHGEKQVEGRDVTEKDG